MASFLGLALLLLGSGAADAFRDIAFLPYLGKFEFTFHGVQGDIYQVDDSTIFVHRFYYDGDGPEGAGVSFMAVPRGENDYGKGQPMDIRMETARNHGRGARFEEIKEAVYNQNLTVKLPRRGKVEGVDDIGRLVFWCNKYGVSFGRVDLDEAREAPLINRPMLDLLYIGSFLQTEHGVNGDVYIMDSQTLVIRDFNFDGRGPPAYLFAGEDNDISTGKLLEYPKKRFRSRFGPDRLEAVNRKDITVELPASLDAYKLKWLSVWCNQYQVSFGHVEF